MRKAFIIAELLMGGSIPILFILPHPENTYVWFGVFISGIIINTEFWKRWTNKSNPIKEPTK